LYCLSFCVMFCRSLFVLFLLAIETLHRRTDNTMAKRKRTNNDLQNITQKDRQYNGQKKKDKRPLYCLSCVMFCISLFDLFLLAIVLSVLLCNVL
jgi:hypothetical protein